VFDTHYIIPVRMKVIIDNREHVLYEKCYSMICAQKNPSYIQLSVEALPLGDILIKTDDNKDVLMIERKSFSDLLSSIKDGRYEEQSYRLVNSSGFPPHSVIYLIEGMFSQVRTPMEKNMIYSAITSLQFFKGFSIQRTSTIAESAEWLLHLADKIEREFQKGRPPYYLTAPFLKYFTKPVVEDAPPMEPTPPSSELTAADYCSVVRKVRKDNISPENIGEIILCQIPGISSTNAIAIMKPFRNFSHFMNEIQTNPGCIENLTYETNGKSRKINKSIVENIRKYLIQSYSTETDDTQEKRMLI
jgi:ERCC4-type nuclease